MYVGNIRICRGGEPSPCQICRGDGVWWPVASSSSSSSTKEEGGDEGEEEEDKLCQKHACQFESENVEKNKINST